MRGGLSHSEHALRPEKVISGVFFSVQRLPSSGQKGQFSCTISKKVAPKAVDRNKARRRARAALRSMGDLRGLYVIHIKKPALTASYARIVEELRAQLARLHGG